MPFADNPREFTKANVKSLNPNQMGCYGLYKSTGWVYVGKGDIRARLLSYLNGENACITREKPTHWVDVVTTDMDNEEKRLIVAHDPICNKKVG